MHSIFPSQSSKSKILLQFSLATYYNETINSNKYSSCPMQTNILSYFFIISVPCIEPGPLNTDMQMVARSKTADPSLRKSFSDMFAQGQLFTCEASCAKLMKLLLEDTYTSGAHIDVYDL